jgi:hypothetical protein
MTAVSAAFAGFPAFISFLYLAFILVLGLHIRIEPGCDEGWHVDGLADRGSAAPDKGMSRPEVPSRRSSARSHKTSIFRRIGRWPALLCLFDLAAGASLPGLRQRFPAQARGRAISVSADLFSLTTDRSRVSNLTKLVVNIQHLASQRDLAKGVSGPSTLPGGRVAARTGSRHIPKSGHTAEVPSLLATAGWATPCGRPAVRVSA